MLVEERRARGVGGEFQGWQQLNGRAGQRARHDEAGDYHASQPVLPFAPPVAEGIQAQSQEAIYRGRSGPGQDQGGAYQAAQSRIAHGRNIDRPPVGQQQPWEHRRPRKQAHVRRVGREEPGKPVGERA